LGGDLGGRGWGRGGVEEVGHGDDGGGSGFGARRKVYLCGIIGGRRVVWDGRRQLV
jgi:hypothetical protein